MFELIGALVVSGALSFAVLGGTFALSSLVMDRFSKQDGLESAITAGMMSFFTAAVTLVLSLHYIVGITIQR